MCQTWPLPDTHPELSILEWPGFREYRVENWRLARDGSARIIRRTSPSVWLLDVCLPPLLLALLWTKVCALLSYPLFVSMQNILGIAAPGEHHALASCRSGPRTLRPVALHPGTIWCVSQAMYFHLYLVSLCIHAERALSAESVLVFPTLGIQLETHRGHPSLQPLLVSRRFIHVGCLENVVIHEGLHRWNVRYFLAAIKRSNNGTLSIHVAFEVGWTSVPLNRSSDVRIEYPTILSGASGSIYRSTEHHLLS